MSMQISSLGGWLVSALPISIGGEWHNSSTDFNPNTNSSILLQGKNKLQVHLKPTPTMQTPSKAERGMGGQYFGRRET